MSTLAVEAILSHFADHSREIVSRFQVDAIGPASRLKNVEVNAIQIAKREYCRALAVKIRSAIPESACDDAVFCVKFVMIERVFE